MYHRNYYNFIPCRDFIHFVFATDNICNMALNSFSTTILYMYTENETVQNAKRCTENTFRTTYNNNIGTEYTPNNYNRID